MDTNIVSTFIKINKFGLLTSLFPNSTLFISGSVKDELRADKRTKAAAEKISIIIPTEGERNLAAQLLSKRNIGKAEAECIAMAKSRGMLLLTNDKIAVKEARKAGADSMDLRAINREKGQYSICRQRHDVFGLA